MHMATNITTSREKNTSETMPVVYGKELGRNGISDCFQRPSREKCVAHRGHRSSILGYFAPRTCIWADGIIFDESSCYEYIDRHVPECDQVEKQDKFSPRVFIETYLRVSI